MNNSPNRGTFLNECAEERNPNWMPCDGDEGDDDE